MRAPYRIRYARGPLGAQQERGSMIPVGEGPVARGTDATTPHLARVTRAGGGDVPGGQFLGEFPSVEIQASAFKLRFLLHVRVRPG